MDKEQNKCSKHSSKGAKVIINTSKNVDPEDSHATRNRCITTQAFGHTSQVWIKYVLEFIFIYYYQIKICHTLLTEKDSTNPSTI